MKYEKYEDAVGRRVYENRRHTNKYVEIFQEAFWYNRFMLIVARITQFRLKEEEKMDKKNLKMILDEGGYINYRNIFKDLEEENPKNLNLEEIDWDESETESELPRWIMNKWKKYDMKDWEKQ